MQLYRLLQNKDTTQLDRIAIGCNAFSSELHAFVAPTAAAAWVHKSHGSWTVAHTSNDWLVGERNGGIKVATSGRQVKRLVIQDYLSN